MEEKIIVGEQDINVDLIDSFPNHPYHVFDDVDMAELVASIEVNGLLNPIIVRNKADGRYEPISGHRRKWAYHTFIHSTDYHIGLLQYFVLYRIFVQRNADS